MEDWKKNIVKLKGEDKTELELWMANLRTASNVEAAINGVKSLRKDYALSITEAKTSLKKCRQALGLHRQAPAAAPAAVGPSFKLPEVKVPVFDGDIARFQSFWGLYTTIIDSASASDEQKFSLLKTKLSGEPANLIRDLPLTPANYASAKDLLNERYGDKKAIARKVRGQLFALPQCKSRQEVKDMFYQAEAYIIQLEAISGQPVNSEETLQFLEQRLPAFYFERLINKKHPTLDWDLLSFRKLMPILIKEDLEILQVTQPERPLLSNQTRTAQTQQQGASRSAPRNIDNRHYGSMAFTTLQQTKSILKQPKTVRFAANQPLSRAENKSIQPTKAVSCLFCRQTNHRALQCPWHPRTE